MEIGLIYKSLSTLLGKEDLIYEENQMKPIKINTLVELKKYSQKVESHLGIIKIGSLISTKKVKAEGVIENKVIKKEDIKFVKKIDSPTVYEVDENTKTLKKILNEKAYKRALDMPLTSQANWSIVKPISDSEFNSYQGYQKEEILDDNIPVSSKIKNLYNQGLKLVKSKTKNTVYFITEDFKKRPIMNGKVFKNLGFKWGDIQEVDDSVLETIIKDENIEEVEDLK